MSCYRLIEAEKPHHRVSRLCRVLGVARAGYYAWAGRPLSQRTAADQTLTNQIRQIHARSRGTYGAPRVHAELRLGLDVHVGRKRVARLMRAAGLQGCHRRRRHGLTRRDPRAVSAADLVERDFTSPAPDRLWVADITQQRTDAGWLYLAVVLDCFSRRIVGWSMGERIDSRLVVDALEMAVSRRLPEEGLVAHSDRGSQYASEHYQRLLAKHGIACSMSRRGDCWDNAPMESFFASLKKELVHGADFPTRAQARAAIVEYIEVFYNTKRRHSSLGYVSPADYERTQKA